MPIWKFVPMSMGFSYQKNFHTCPNCGYESKDRGAPEKFVVEFNPDTLCVNLTCNECGHKWEVK